MAWKAGIEGRQRRRGRREWGVRRLLCYPSVKCAVSRGTKHASSIFYHPTTRQTALGTKASSGLTLISIESQFLHPLMIQDSEVEDSKMDGLGGPSHGPAIFCAAGGAAVWHEIYGDIIRREEGERKKESP